MDELPDPAAPHFETHAASSIRRRLEAHGHAPWSLCEARLDGGDYLRLTRWATDVEKWRLGDGGGGSGLVLLTFISEWNRRNSPGDSVWVGLKSCFGVKATRDHLFNGLNQPTEHLRRLMRRCCREFDLRHAFAPEQDEDFPYYLTVQLQYGFSMPHARAQLGNWLRGHKPPEVALRLLEPEGHYRSRSFRRLVQDLKSYRRNYLPESELRRTLRGSPWVLQEWVDEIVSLIDETPWDSVEDEADFRLLSDPRVVWEAGPEVWCRVCDLPPRMTEPRYILRHAGRDIARYYRLRSGAIEADRRDAEISLDGPEAVVTLETPDRRVVELQSIRLWDPEVVAQSRPIGRESEEASERLMAGEQVLITSGEAVLDPCPETWRSIGPQKWRWWLLDGRERVRVEDRGVVWTGEPPPAPPPWASSVSVACEPAGTSFTLGDSVAFRFGTSPGVEIAHASFAGQPLNFLNRERTRTSPIRVRSEMSGRGRLRVGATRGAHLAVVRPEIELRVRAALWADDGTAIPRDESLRCFEAISRPVRLLSDGPALLIEGREVLGELRTDRPCRINRVLGTGQEVLVADRRFNTEDRFIVARSAVDTGVVRSLDRRGDELRLRLFHPLVPSDHHQLLLWSPDRGPTILDSQEVISEDLGRTWAARVPWEVGTILVAVAYEGRRIGAAWSGREEDFFDPGGAESLDLLARIALIRWCRLPGLRPDPGTPRLPLIARLTGDPLPMVRVALRDEGLPDDLGLVFEERQGPQGELFNVIFREAFVAPSNDDLAAIFHELQSEDFNRLLVYHPVLGGRSFQAVLSKLMKQSAPLARALLRATWLSLLSLDGNADARAIARREADLLDRGCDEGKLLDEHAMQEGLIRPVVASMFDQIPLDEVQESNLRTALGVATFREYLAAAILRRLMQRLD